MGEVSTTAEMDTSPTAGDGNKMDLLLDMVRELSKSVNSIDERVKELEMDNENSTVAIKSECSDKERYEVNLTSLGFLLPEDSGRYKHEASIEKLSDNVVQNMNKLWPNVGKNFYKIKKYLIELFSLHGCEYIANDEPSPISIDHIVKEYNAAEEEDQREDAAFPSCMILPTFSCSILILFNIPLIVFFF